MEQEYIQKLVIARLRSMPPNVNFSIGEFGDYSRDQLIEQVMQNTQVGKATIKMELNFLREMPKLSSKLRTA